MEKEITNKLPQECDVHESDGTDNADAGTGLWNFCPNCGAKMKGGAG